MDPLLLLTIAVFAPITCGVATLALPRQALGARVAVAVAGPVLSVAALAWLIGAFGTACPPVAIEWMPGFELDLAWNPDKLGLFFALLVSVIGLLITLYARAYFGPDRDSLFRFFPCLHLFMTAMLGVALADNFMLLLLFWELTSISSFLLIGWDRDQPDSVRKAMQAFVVTAGGGLVMMAGLILLGLETDQWTFSGLLAEGTLKPNAPIVASFVMIFVGAAAKSAQIPFHFWLPGAMAAPTPVSAYLHSATMVKAGVYLTGRLWPIFAAVLPQWPGLIIPLGAATMVYGAFIALQKTDLKQIFAYTTVSQLGLLMTMYGLGAFSYAHGGHTEPNLIWDMTQILNHALYKAPLFILAGAIGHVASRQLPELKGLFYRGGTERIMTVVILLAAYALAAGPLTLSFSAKEMFFYQIYHAKEALGSWGWPLVIAAVATGMFNVAIFIRLATTMLSRRGAAEAAETQHGHDSGHGGGPDYAPETGMWPAFLWIPGALIVAFQFIGGIIPGAYGALFGWLEPDRSLNYFTSLDAFPMTWDLLAHPGFPLYMSLFAILFGVLLGLAPVLRGAYHDPFDRAYPGFYRLTTRGGGRLFGLVQTGNARMYVLVVFVALIGLFVWSIRFDFASLADQWPGAASYLADADHPHELRAAALVTILVCLSALLMPIVKDRASRVLVLGTCGFSVTAVYYLYKAPDLALTQVSIEIVSLILFLLVLSLLPNHKPSRQLWVVPRLLVAVGVGLIMFWLTLTSSTGTRPPLPYTTAEGRPLAHLGEFFLRNARHGRDTVSVPGSKVYGGVVDRGSEHSISFGTGEHGAKPHETAVEGATTTIHKGGGGRNVVNVILVDFRGFDTMGEITVLGLSALGVWTLLRRFRRSEDGAEPTTATDDEADRPQTPGAERPFARIDIPEPSDGLGLEDEALTIRSGQS